METLSLLPWGQKATRVERGKKRRRKGKGGEERGRQPPAGFVSDRGWPFPAPDSSFPFWFGRGKPSSAWKINGGRTVVATNYGEGKRPVCIANNRNHGSSRKCTKLNVNEVKRRRKRRNTVGIVQFLMDQVSLKEKNVAHTLSDGTEARDIFRYDLSPLLILLDTTRSWLFTLHYYRRFSLNIHNRELMKI